MEAEEMNAFLSERYIPGNPIRLNAYPSLKICPNSHKHVSAFPGYDRIICPECLRVYINKEMK